MVKTSVLLLTLIVSSLLTGKASAKLQTRYTVTCNFDDGLGWALTFEDYGAALLYDYTCQSNQGNSSIQLS